MTTETCLKCGTPYRHAKGLLKWCAECRSTPAYKREYMRSYKFWYYTLNHERCLQDQREYRQRKKRDVLRRKLRG